MLKLDHFHYYIPLSGNDVCTSLNIYQKATLFYNDLSVLADIYMPTISLSYQLRKEIPVRPVICLILALGDNHRLK